MEPSSHYGEEYYKWQSAAGEFGAQANLFKFKEFINEADKVLEFGCGGGFLLDILKCQDKIGVEINPVARSAVIKKGIRCHESCDQVTDGWADIVISNSVLEHVHNPLETLCALKRVLRPGGRIIFVVPHEKLRWRYSPNDINQHLYTWSPMTLGNLFNTAGFVVQQVDVIKHIWPPRYHIQIYRLFGSRIFNIACRIYARIGGGLWIPLRVVAINKLIN